MKDLTPNKAELDPIEIASIDEIRSLQLERLKWSLRHAYDNVPMY
ncbi:MAG: phenylacetate--CoA ligase, partial [Pseudomonadota bacterium]|nr:phenylacetate--CoA ligase [Pseudomonadota bacterium]